MIEPTDEQMLFTECMEIIEAKGEAIEAWKGWVHSIWTPSYDIPATGAAFGQHDGVSWSYALHGVSYGG